MNNYSIRILSDPIYILKNPTDFFNTIILYTEGVSKSSDVKNSPEMNELERDMIPV